MSELGIIPESNFESKKTSINCTAKGHPELLGRNSLSKVKSESGSNNDMHMHVFNDSYPHEFLIENSTGFGMIEVLVFPKNELEIQTFEMMELPNKHDTEEERKLKIQFDFPYLAITLEKREIKETNESPLKFRKNFVNKPPTLRKIFSKENSTSILKKKDSLRNSNPAK